jgi:medium-chain acyl-[acyl-carrier-protein] hydrolase
MIVTESESSDGLVDGSNRLWFESLSSIKGQSLRLFCFPYAGGSAHVFRNWQRPFLPYVGLCLVHLPGRGTRIAERPFTRLKLLVQNVADVIMREPQRPYVLYGHSLGALISFELTRELRHRRFIPPMWLFLSGCGAPNIPSREAPIFDLPEETFIAEVRKFNGTPQEMFDDQELRKIFVPVLRADCEMVGTYEYDPQEPLSCPITLYGGLHDQHVSINNLRAWKEHTSASCTVRMFPGDHFFINNADVGFVDVLRGDVLDALHCRLLAV